MSGVTLLTYADRFGGGLGELKRLLDGPLSVFAGVHILPFFVPFDGADTGFDPRDHGTVDPRLGSWADIRSLSENCGITADLIANHVSADSDEFRDWLEHGQDSVHNGMFLTFDTVFPDGGTEAQITGFYRPRPGLPFTPYVSASGQRRLVWTTFMPTQVDLDVRHPAARAYLRRILQRLADGGVTTVRLDAVGYAVKTPGTDSFMTEETLGFVGEIAEMVRSAGMRVLVEVHAHYSQQAAVSPLVDLVYDFALPPLLLHSLGTGTADRLARWLEIRPQNAVTVLDTHDGIGIIDAGPGAGRPGLLSQEEMAAIFQRASAATEGHSELASVIPAWFVLPHQINATFFSVLGRDANAYLLARAVQFWFPGEPQVYYVGLLGGLDDVGQYQRTGNGRDVNRHVYDAGEVRSALRSDVTRALLSLIRIRSEHAAFDGQFSYSLPAPEKLELTWSSGQSIANLQVCFTTPSFRIELTSGAGSKVFESIEDLRDAGGGVAEE